VRLCRTPPRKRQRRNTTTTAPTVPQAFALRSYCHTVEFEIGFSSETLSDFIFNPSMASLIADPVFVYLIGAIEWTTHPLLATKMAAFVTGRLTDLRLVSNTATYPGSEPRSRGSHTIIPASLTARGSGTQLAEDHGHQQCLR
jgi:hypothetical protein